MNEMNGYDIEDLRVGMSATFSKTITEADIVLFAGVSGDTNAIHINEEYAATTAFNGRIAHGFLSASVISAAVATRLPGPGSIYMDQHLRFLAPVRPGDTLTGWIECAARIPSKSKPALGVIHETWTATNQKGELVMTAKGINMVRRRPI